jgi:hypothetical protein
MAFDHGQRDSAQFHPAAAFDYDGHAGETDS